MKKTKIKPRIELEFAEDNWSLIMQPHHDYPAEWSTLSKYDETDAVAEVEELFDIRNEDIDKLVEGLDLYRRQLGPIEYRNG